MKYENIEKFIPYSLVDVAFYVYLAALPLNILMSFR